MVHGRLSDFLTLRPFRDRTGRVIRTPLTCHNASTGPLLATAAPCCAVSMSRLSVPALLASAPCLLTSRNRHVSKPSGFGYRAKYIVESAKLIHANGGADWALDLRSKDREEVRAQLVTLCGVGPKVLENILREGGRKAKELWQLLACCRVWPCCKREGCCPCQMHGKSVGACLSLAGHRAFAPSEMASGEVCFTHAQPMALSVGPFVHPAGRRLHCLIQPGPGVDHPGRCTQG